MQYTLGQAMRRLAASSQAYGQTDLRELINTAIQALAGMTGWECLRKVLRFSSVGPGFVLPQGCAGLVRVCVNGSPTTVRGQDFRFIQSGPGDVVHPPRGFCRVRPENVYDIGMKPVMLEPPNAFRLFVFTPSGLKKDSKGEPLAVTVRGLDTKGEIVQTVLPPHMKTTYSPSTGLPDGGEDIYAVEPESPVFRQILEVSIPDAATEYYTLFAEDNFTMERFPIGVYHPEVKAPQFRHYEIVGVPPGKCVEILAETRVDPIPLVDNTDVLPFSAIEPIEWMIRADWQMKAGEVTAAKNYQDMAAKWLKAQEITDDTIQTSIVINSVFAGSPGEISMESVNI